MSPLQLETNKSLIRDYIERIVNTGNTTEIGRYIAESYAEVYMGARYELGLEGAIKHIQGVRETYPDLRLEIDMQVAEGDWVATSYTMTGTHVGSWMGIKPTGKLLRTTGVNLDRIENGKIVEHGGAANLFTSLLEIGAIKVVE